MKNIKEGFKSKEKIMNSIFIMTAVFFVLFTLFSFLINIIGNKPSENIESSPTVPLIVHAKEFLIYDNGTLRVDVYYESGKNMTEMDFIFENDKGNTKRLKKNNINQELNETKTYNFNKIEVGLNNVTRVSVIPIYNSKEGSKSIIETKKIVLLNKNPYCHLNYGIQSTVFNNSVVLYINFDNNTKDISEGGNNGILFGNASVNSAGGKENGGLQLDGEGDYVQIPAFNENFSSITITTWVKGNDIGSSTGIVFSRDSTQPLGLNYKFKSGKVSYHWNNNSASTWNFESGLSIPVNKWSFIALSLNPNTVTLYVSNSSGLFSKSNPIKHYNQLSDSEWRIGSDSFTDEGYFNGSIDEVMIFNRSLTTEEINGLYDCYPYR